MQGIHGGDTYRNAVSLDFSVNVNPLGMPDEVEEALHKAVELCGRYPDTEAEKLTAAVSDRLSVPKDYLLFGNGASELFAAVVHALRPRKTLIPVPSFYGYEYAAGMTEGELLYYPLQEKELFLPGERLFQALTEEVELLFLANPNNPTGGLISREYLQKLLTICKTRDIYMVLDECFIDFCGQEYSMLPELGRYDKLLLVRAFTKTYAVPGVRLGYLLCSSRELLEKVRRQLPEWNLSVFAQAAGRVCAGEREYLEKTVAYVREERQFLTEGLKRLGLRVFPGEAVFLLVYSELSLYRGLLEQGILIRDCENFRGLSRGYYRIAVKSRKDNERLLKAIGELYERNRVFTAGGD